MYRLDSLINPIPNRPKLTYEFLHDTRLALNERADEGSARQGAHCPDRPGTVPQLKRYLDEHEEHPARRCGIDIPPLNSQAKERLGYSTQKPVTLLKRIGSDLLERGGRRSRPLLRLRIDH